MSPTITAAILAGGAATRLGGHDKGLRMLGDRTLIAWTCDALCAQVDAVLIVANRNLDAYAKHAPVIPDALEGFRGPLAGIAAALTRLADGWVLTAPVDCPQPPTDLAERLARALRASAAPAVVAHDGVRRQPLFALYREGWAASAAAAAAAGQGPAQWQNAIGAIELDFADRHRQFENLNTPEDFIDHDARFRRDR
jgi:molybdenum cofactor guanylyltransferase